MDSFGLYFLKKKNGKVFKHVNYQGDFYFKCEKSKFKKNVMNIYKKIWGKIGKLRCKIYSGFSNRNLMNLKKNLRKRNFAKIIEDS